MTKTRTYLPYDYARCMGKSLEGQLIKPCTNCAREKFKEEINPYGQSWIQGNPMDGTCDSFIDLVWGYDEN